LIVNRLKGLFRILNLYINNCGNKHLKLNMGNNTPPFQGVEITVE